MEKLTECVVDLAATFKSIFSKAPADVAVDNTKQRTLIYGKNFNSKIISWQSDTIERNFH